MSEGTNPAADFAAMMSQAAETAYAEADQAPYGYTRDSATGEMRPKKAPGRPRKPPSVDELKAEKAEQDEQDAEKPPIEGKVVGDRPPEQPRGGRKGRRGGEEKPKEPVPQFREGQIEKAVNRLYRKAGRIIRVMDREIGQAVIEAATKEDDDDLTVGAAWEEVCRHNPAIRRVVLKFLKGGAYGQLFWAHAPILLAIFMKDAIRSRIPFSNLMGAFLGEADDDDSPAAGAPFEGVSPDDMQQAMAFAAQMMPGMFNGRGFQMPRMPEAPEAA